MTFDALISDTDRDDKLEARWLGEVPKSAVVALANYLSALRGVEKVYQHRYSLEVFFAPHVISKQEVYSIIIDAIEEVEKLF